MINNDQSTSFLYCCENVKSHRSGGDTVPLIELTVCVLMSLIEIQAGNTREEFVNYSSSGTNRT